MRASLKELLDHLSLERLEENLFRGESRDIGSTRVFGGQVLGQSLRAASGTVDPARKAHSLHAYFLRAGDPEAPIVYDVDRARDGRSFSTRRVVAIQHGRPIFNMSASFHVEEDGLEHQFPMPVVPTPEDIGEPRPVPESVLKEIPEKMRRWVTRESPIEFRPVLQLDPVNPPKQPPQQYIWMRCRGELPDDPLLHRCLLAYASDFYLIWTAALPHGLSFLKGNVQMASLDHAMWFHREFRMDEWLLYACDSPSSSHSLGLARGMFFDRQGRLVASTAQEGLIRQWD